MIWEAWQWRSIERAHSKASDAKASASQLAADLARLEDALERLVLINRAMWELLGERAAVTDEDLAAKVRELDLQDGKLDGKLRSGVRQCPRCQRTLAKRRAVCLYCGAEEERADPFRQV